MSTTRRRRKTRDYRAQDCTGKRAYPTYTAARHAARRTSAHRTGDRFAPYRCRYCQSFHVGSQPTRAVQAQIGHGQQLTRPRLPTLAKLPAKIRRALDALAAQAKAVP